MTYVLTQPVEGVDYNQNQCRLLWDNLFDYATSVTASSEDSSFPVENAYDWLVSDFFAPATNGQYTITCVFSSSKTANSMAFYKTDLQDNGGTIKLQYLDTDGVTWVDATDNISPSDTAPRIEYFDSQSSTQWRFVISSNPASNIGMLWFGEYMALQIGVWQGFTPPKFARNNNYLTSVSQQGNFIGRSITHNAGSVSLPVEYATESWARSNWYPFIKHAEKKPFFMSWNVSSYPTESAFCWSDTKSFSMSNQTFDRMQETLKLRVLTE